MFPIDTTESRLHLHITVCLSSWSYSPCARFFEQMYKHTIYNLVGLVFCYCFPTIMLAYYLSESAVSVFDLSVVITQKIPLES